MVRRISHRVVNCCLALLLLCGNAVAVPLAEYSFDDSLTDTGPDTFRVFEEAKGRVSLSGSDAYSGYYSVQLQDVAGDHDFPELQGYFPVQREGHVYFHFAFSVTDPGQEFNIALAGPQGFVLRRDALAVWLSLQNGWLRHTSDSIPKRLIELAPFVWYVVDIDYAVAEGRYDLRISDGATALVDIHGAANAASHPGSVVDKFSFVGDLWQDLSNVNYFVDDIWISADSAEMPGAFVAPGRRKLFIDRWNDTQHWLQANGGCLPVALPEDFGISQAWLNTNVDKDTRKAFWKALAGRQVNTDLPSPLDAWQPGLSAWYEGCKELAHDQAETALEKFKAAGAALPLAPLVQLSQLQALARLQRWDEVDNALPTVAAAWDGDLRFAVVVGQIGFARGDLQFADAWGEVAAEHIPDGDFMAWAKSRFGDDNDKLAQLQSKLSSPVASRHLQRYVLAEQHFFSLLWSGKYNEAMAYAQRMAEHFADFPLVRATWLERNGDAAFLGGMENSAAQVYRDSLQADPGNSGAMEKLSDLAFLAGDTAGERHYREAVYGTLHK